VRGRKQLSGAQKRKLAKARALAGQVLMPRAPSPKEYESLTGIARLMGKHHRDYMQGRMAPDAYLVSVQGLRALSTALQAVEAERQREIDERLAAGIEALERQREPGAPAIEYTPRAQIGPVGGELMPRESSDGAES
jgi:hypothetical protein